MYHQKPHLDQKVGEVEEDGSPFELEELVRVSLLGKRSKDTSVKICGDGDWQDKEDTLAYCLCFQKTTWREIRGHLEIRS